MIGTRKMLIGYTRMEQPRN